MNVKEKQILLKQLIKKLGWSQKKFSRRFFWEIYDSDNETEIKQFEEKFKKQISRKSTNEKLIDSYIDFLFSLEEAAQLEYKRPCNFSEFDFSKEFNRKMKQISKNINDQIL